MPAIIHPLVDVPCPTLGDLLERAGRELGRALTTAGRLAARRIALQDQALALREAIIAAPWEEWSPPWPIPPRALTPGDLARALLAELPDVVEGLLFAGEARRSEYTDQRWREDVERWRAAAAEPGPALDPALPLVRPWARRWALILADRSAQPLATIQALAEPVRAAMIGYVGFYGDGMGVAGEAREALRRAVGAAAEREGVAYDRIGPGLGTPYYDRHGGVAALEAALARGPGAILVGEVGSGRRSLLEAVAGRVRRREGPPELAGFVSAVDRCDQPPAFVDGGLVLPINRVERHVLGLVGLGVGPALGPASDPGQGPWLAALGELLARSGDGDRLRLVLGITPGERWRLRALLPAASELPEIEVPAIGASDRVAIAMCKVFALEEAAKGPVDLARILWWLARRTAGDRDLERIDDLAQPAPRHFSRLLARRVAEGRQPAGRVAQILERLELSAADLTVLLEIEARLLAG